MLGIVILMGPQCDEIGFPVSVLAAQCYHQALIYCGLTVSRHPSVGRDMLHIKYPPFCRPSPLISSHHNRDMKH